MFCRLMSDVQNGPTIVEGATDVVPDRQGRRGPPSRRRAPVGRPDRRHDRRGTVQPRRDGLPPDRRRRSDRKSCPNGHHRQLILSTPRRGRALSTPVRAATSADVVTAISAGTGGWLSRSIKGMAVRRRLPGRLPFIRNSRDRRRPRISHWAYQPTVVGYGEMIIVTSAGGLLAQASRVTGASDRWQDRGHR